MNSINRRGLGAAALGTGAIVALGSAAFACTTYRGIMTLNVTAGSDSHATHTQTQAIGNQSGMNYCSTYPGGWVGNPNGAVHVDDGAATKTITVAVGPSDYCMAGLLNPANKLPRSGLIGTLIYRVNFSNGKIFSSDSHTAPYMFQASCMNGATGSVNLSDTSGDNAFTVNNTGSFDPDASGTSTKTFNLAMALSPHATGEDGGVCVADTGNGSGNQVPITIV